MKKVIAFVSVLFLGSVSMNAQYPSSWSDPPLQKQIESNIENTVKAMQG